MVFDSISAWLPDWEDYKTLGRKCVDLQEKLSMSDLSSRHLAASSVKASGGFLPMKDDANVKIKCFQDQ